MTEEALAISRQVDDMERIALTLFILGLLSSSQGDYTRAVALFEESVATYRASGNKRGIAHSLSQLAQVLLVSQADQTRISPLLEECLALSQEVGYKEGIAAYYCLSGQLALGRRDLAMARSLAEKSVTLYREIGHRHGTANALALLGGVLATEGDYAVAQTLFEQSLTISCELNEKWVASVYLVVLGEVVAAQQKLAWAAQLWGAAEALRDAFGVPIPLAQRADYERSISAARVHLGERAFAASWAQGRSMTPEHGGAAPAGGWFDRHPDSRKVDSEPSHRPCPYQLHLQQAGRDLTQRGNPLCHRAPPGLNCCSQSYMFSIGHMLITRCFLTTTIAGIPRARNS